MSELDDEDVARHSELFSYGEALFVGIDSHDTTQQACFLNIGKQPCYRSSKEFRIEGDFGS